MPGLDLVPAGTLEAQRIALVRAATRCEQLIERGKATSPTFKEQYREFKSGLKLMLLSPQFRNYIYTNRIDQWSSFGSATSFTRAAKLGALLDAAYHFLHSNKTEQSIALQKRFKDEATTAYRAAYPNASSPDLLKTIERADADLTRIVNTYSEGNRVLPGFFKFVANAASGMGKAVDDTFYVVPPDFVPDMHDLSLPPAAHPKDLAIEVVK